MKRLLFVVLIVGLLFTVGCTEEQWMKAGVIVETAETAVEMGTPMATTINPALLPILLTLKIVLLGAGTIIGRRLGRKGAEKKAGEAIRETMKLIDLAKHSEDSKLAANAKELLKFMEKHEDEAEPAIAAMYQLFNAYRRGQK